MLISLVDSYRGFDGLDRCLVSWMKKPTGKTPVQKNHT